MSNGQLVVTAKLTNEKVHFVGISETNPDRSIEMDYLPPIGDGEGYRGLELLLISFAGCVSTAVVCLIRRLGKDITGYSIKVEGIKQEQPLMLKGINFEVALESKDATGEDLTTVLGQAEKISPVWLAIKNNVEVTASYKLI